MKASTQNLTRADLLAIPTPVKTASYTPITCEQIFNTLDKLCLEFGISVKSENFTIRRHGDQQRMRFFFDGNIDTFSKELVIINSYNKSIALRAAAGTSVVVCSNGVLVGNIKIYKKHTSNVDVLFEEFLRDCIADMTNLYQFAEDTAAEYKDVILTEEDIARYLGEMFFSEDTLSSTQLNIVKREFEKPSYDYGCDPYSLWAFYQHLTLALNKENVEDYLETRIAIQENIGNIYLNMGENVVDEDESEDEDENYIDYVTFDDEE